MQPFSHSEYAGRLANLRAEMARAEVDTYLVASGDNLYYLTGVWFEQFERPFFLVVFRDPARPTVFIVPFLENGHARGAHLVEHLESYWDYPAPPGRGWTDALGRVLENTRSLGVEPTLRAEVLDACRQVGWRSLTLIENIRLRKSQAEIARIRRAAHYADMAVGELLRRSYQGASVAEGFVRTGKVAGAIMKSVHDWEALTTRVAMATWAAPRSSQPHSIPHLDDVMNDGPHVALALTRVCGYSAESERAYFTAPPSPMWRDAFQAMQAARAHGASLLRPGLSCSELDESTTAILARRGYGDERQRLHRTGHGLGLGNHEGPWLSAGSDQVLDEGMVVSIEPGIYISDEGGVRHSDTYLITRDGSERLTNAPDDLESLTMPRYNLLARAAGSVLRHALRLQEKRVHHQMRLLALAGPRL